MRYVGSGWSYVNKIILNYREIEASEFELQCVCGRFAVNFTSTYQVYQKALDLFDLTSLFRDRMIGSNYQETNYRELTVAIYRLLKTSSPIQMKKKNVFIKVAALNPSKYLKTEKIRPKRHTFHSFKFVNCA